MKERVVELESYVMSQLQTNCPIYTGNSLRNITALGTGHIRLSAPPYKVFGFYDDYTPHYEPIKPKEVKKPKKIKYKEKMPQPKFTSRFYRGYGKIYKLTHTTVGRTDFTHYAFLLNAVGAFGSGRHQFWVNRAVYNACVMYANQIGANVINHLEL